MQTEIQIKPLGFDFNGQSVRAIHRHGQPWFVAKEVLAILEIADKKQALRKLSDTERGVCSIHPPWGAPGGPQEHAIVSESGLYKLILRSSKPEAEAFCDWVTGEVLPAIRKTGFYALGLERMTGAAAVEINRALAKRRLLRELTELETEPAEGVDYRTLADFLSARGLELDPKAKAAFARDVARRAKAMNLPFVVIYARTRPDKHWPLPALEAAAVVLPPNPQLQLT